MSDSALLLMVGGGRWCRTTILELVKMTEVVFQIVVLSRKNKANMQEWVRINALEHRVKVVSDLAETASDFELIYVTNESKLRFETLGNVLDLAAPTLVEKPFMLDTQDALKTIKNFEDANVMLFSANVLRYLHSLEVFRGAISNQDLLSIKFFWEDSTGEFRHGEMKNFESKVPVYADIFPHIYGILVELFPSIDLKLDSVSSHDVYQDVNASLTLNSKTIVELSITRFGKKRKRLVEAHTAEKVVTLDFAEAEHVFQKSRNDSLSILYSGSTSGIQELFRDFQRSTNTGMSSGRLDPYRSLECLKLCDEVRTTLLE